jgi:hypothetical protein
VRRRRKNTSDSLETLGPIVIMAFFGTLLVGMVLDVSIQGVKP